MQKPEIVDTILSLQRRNPTIKNKEIALALHVHRNTASKYVNFIRDNYVKTPEEIVNKIDDKLDEELEDMSHRDLINYRRAVTPTKIEAHTVEELKLKLEERHVSIIGTLKDYERALERAASQNLRADRAEKQMDTTPADA